MRFSVYLFLLSIGFLSKAQSYVPVLDQLNEWHLGYCDDNGCYKDIYYTDGDTIAFGHQYKILDGYHYISRKFLLREEISERKVYLNVTLPNGQNDEYMLYDFNLNEGDSIRMLNSVSPFPEDLGYFKLDSIRNKPVLENQTANYYYFSNTLANTGGFGYLPVWVEGVGSLSIVNAPGGDPNYFGVGQLACFWKNGNLYFHDNQMGIDCDSVLKSDEADRPKKISVFPNPVTDELFIKSPDIIDRLSLFDANGRIIFEGKAKPVFKINTANWPKGVYFIRIYANGRIQTEKILKK